MKPQNFSQKNQNFGPRKSIKDFLGKENKAKKGKVYLFETSVEPANRTVDFRKECKDEQYPTGLLYLDAVLRKNSYEVLTKYYTPLYEYICMSEIKKEIERFKPDFVGITMMSMTRVSAYKAIKMIKKISPETKIILGGIHPSIMYEQLLQNFPVEAVCIGEGEETIVELLDTLADKKSLKKVKGIAYKEKNKVIVNEMRRPKMDLDNLPFPSYDVFMNPSIKRVKILSSRGCPNKCSFCCMNIANKHVWRPRSPKNVVDEIEFIKKTYPWVDSIQFLDDTMTLDNNRVIEMCKEILRRRIKLKFDGQGRIKPVSREMFYWLQKAGFTAFYFGVESGSEKILDSIHKNITKEDCINTFKILREFPKIQVERCLMVGLPGETEETVNETIEFIKKLQKIKKSTDLFYASPLWVFPGTEVYQLAVSKGAIKDNYWLTDKPVPFYTVEHPEKWLIKMSNKITLAAMLDRGKIHFARKVLERAMINPLHYIRRFLAIPAGKALNN